MTSSPDDTFDMVLSKLKRVQRRGETAKACCPVHADRKPSLSIKREASGRVLIHCFAGCAVSDVLASLELDELDLDPDLEAIYRYEDGEGSLLYEKLRKSNKRFLFRRPKAGGGYAYSLKGVSLVLYNLRLIAHHRAEAQKAGNTPVVVLVEGEKDADRVVREGLLATTTSSGAKSHWKPEYSDALAGFVVVAIPDNDAPGRHFSRTAADALTRAGIQVRVLELPGLAEGGDVSDWLDAGGNVEKLQELAKTIAPWQASTTRDQPTGEAKFVETPSGVFARVRGREGEETLLQLTNFSARIAEDVVHDDGAERTRKYRVTSPQFSGQVEVMAADFQTLNWVAELGGARAIVRSGLGVRGRIPEAIQVLSQECLQERTVYTHLGWREIGKEWYYLHAGGAIGAQGPTNHIEVETEGRLRDCSLPSVRDVRLAIHASLRVLTVAPSRITYALLAAVYRAPLSECAAATTAVYIAGETGSRKSAITGIAQSHFGPPFADGKTFVANWSSTGNSIERMAFLAKDMICTVDDFVIKGAQSEVQRLQRTADQIIRGQGNKAGRLRMRADSTLRTEMYPRGVIVASGESIPEGKSLGARMLVIDIGPQDVNNDILTTLQRDARAGLLAEAMAGYVQWLAPQMPVLKKTLGMRQDEFRARVTATHARTSENAAQFYLGFEVFMAFAVAAGAVDENEKNEHLARAWQVFVEQALVQDRHIKNEDPIEHFFSLLKTILTSGNRGHLQARTGQRPSPATSFGWQQQIRERHSDAGERIEYTEWRAGGDLIGWVDGDDLYLESHAAYAAVKKLATDNNLPMPVPVQQLGKRLKERGLLLSTRADNENKGQVTVSGRVYTTVFHLSALQAIGVSAAVEEEDDRHTPF